MIYGAAGCPSSLSVRFTAAKVRKNCGACKAFALANHHISISRPIFNISEPPHRHRFSTLFSTHARRARMPVRTDFAGRLEAAAEVVFFCIEFGWETAMPPHRILTFPPPPAHRPAASGNRRGAVARNCAESGVFRGFYEREPRMPKNQSVSKSRKNLTF